MSPDPLLFSTSSPSFPWLLPIISDFSTNLENLRFEGMPYQDEKVMEGNIQQILDMITSTNPGRVKLEENSLLLDFQGNSIEGLSMSNCLIEPPSSRTPSLTPLTSCSSSSFSSYPTLFTFPSLISTNPSFNQSVLCDNVNEDSTLAASDTTCEFIPFTSSSSSSSPPSSHAHLNMFPPTIQSTSHPELANNNETSLIIPCPSDHPSLSLDSCFGAPTNPLINIDQENYLVNHAKQAHVDGVSPSLLLTSLNYSEVALPLPLALSSSHGSSLCATHEELSADHDIVAQESFVNSSPRGYPKPSIALTDCCSDLLGSTRHHHHHQYIHQHHDPPSPHTLLEDGNLPLNMLHGSTMQSTSLDAFGHLNISHHNHNGEFVRPFLHGEGGHSSLSELDNPEEDLKDLNLNMNGVDVLLSDVQLTSQGFCQYTKEEKEKRIGRYRKKRNERNFNKKIKYACRKTLADNRPRIKGRFAKTDDTF